MLRRLFVAVALLFAVPVHAANYLVTYTGTVSGYDSYNFNPFPDDPPAWTGYFGGPGGALTGDFTAVYTFAYPLPDANAYFDAYVGEISWDYLNQMGLPIQADLTINGVTKHFFGPRFSYVRQYDAQGTGQATKTDGVAALSRDLSEWVSNSVTSDSHQITTSTDFTQPLDYTVQPGDSTASDFQFDYDTPIGPGRAGGTLTAERVTIALAAGAVPEPATWAMALVGFGMVAGAMRGSRRLRLRAMLAARP